MFGDRPPFSQWWDFAFSLWCNVALISLTQIYELCTAELMLSKQNNFQTKGHVCVTLTARASYRKQLFFLISATETKLRVSDVAIICGITDGHAERSVISLLEIVCYLRLLCIQEALKQKIISTSASGCPAPYHVPTLPREIKPSQREVISSLDHQIIQTIQVFDSIFFLLIWTLGS